MFLDIDIRGLKTLEYPHLQDSTLVKRTLHTFFLKVNYFASEYYFLFQQAMLTLILASNIQAMMYT